MGLIKILKIAAGLLLVILVLAIFLGIKLQKEDAGGVYQSGKEVTLTRPLITIQIEKPNNFDVMDYSGWYFTISPHRSLIDEYSCFNNGEPLIKISTFDKSNYQYAMSQQSANDISEETFKDKSYTVTIPPNNTFNRLKYYTVKGKYNLLEILYFPGACLYKDKNYDEELHSILGSLQFTEIATGNKGTLDDVSIINWKKPPIQIN